MRRCRLDDRLSTLEKASRRGEALIEIFGIKMTQAAFDRAFKNAQGTTIRPVREPLDDDRLD